jgi:uncharacterized protein (TIGR02646 family)
MRPVERGELPLGSNGDALVFKQYKDAAPHLKSRVGKFCSYCELKFPNTHVEHVQPKSLENHLANSWSNFLLACPYCNGIKKDTPIQLDNYFWPDQDNTFIPFVYERDRAPQISANLSATEKVIAQNTLSLTGLDREPTHPKFSFTDERWHERNESWGKAERAKLHLSNQPTDLMRNQIIDTATSTGFWSIWMTVF